MQFVWKRLGEVPARCLWALRVLVMGWNAQTSALVLKRDRGRGEMWPGLRRGPVLLYQLTIKSCSQSFTNTNPCLEAIRVPFVSLVAGGKSSRKSLPDRQDRVLFSLPAPNETGPHPSLPEEQRPFTRHSLAAILTLAGVFPSSSASEKVLTLWLWWM